MKKLLIITLALIAMSCAKEPTATITFYNISDSHFEVVEVYVNRELVCEANDFMFRHGFSVGGIPHNSHVHMMLDDKNVSIFSVMSKFEADVEVYYSEPFGGGNSMLEYVWQ